MFHLRACCKRARKKVRSPSKTHHTFLSPARPPADHQHHFLILGFHDEERSDFVEGEDGIGAACGGAAEQQDCAGGLSSVHPLRLNFGRNTLSPVREHQDNDIVALMQQRVNTTSVGCAKGPKICRK